MYNINPYIFKLWLYNVRVIRSLSIFSSSQTTSSSHLLVLAVACLQRVSAKLHLRTSPSPSAQTPMSPSHVFARTSQQIDSSLVFARTSQQIDLSLVFARTSHQTRRSDSQNVASLRLENCRHRSDSQIIAQILFVFVHCF